MLLRVQPDSGTSRPYDAIIIGSGAGGGTLAYQLTAAGLSVLLVERGQRMTALSATPGQPVGRFLYHEVKDASEPLSYVGGQTKFYGSALYRFRESDFEAVQHEGGISPAWPIRYADLAPYYDQAEVLYRVHGDPGGDPTEPPRGPYPYPALPQDRIIQRFASDLHRSGTSTAPIPRGLDYREGGRCVMCATCDAHYCQLDAKMDAETAALAHASATGNLHLLTGTDCLRVLTDPAGSAVRGVQLRLPSGEEQMLECPVVAVCAGLPGSALLLRRSRTDAHPDGLGNAGGALGRFLGGHATGMVFPFMGIGTVPAAHTKDFAINAFYNGAPDWPYPLGVIQTAGQTPFWSLMSRALRPVGHMVAKHSITCFYMSEALPTRESGLVFDGDKAVDKVLPAYSLGSFAKLRSAAVGLFKKAGYRSLARKRAPYLWHETGTVRMGEGPDGSVVDADCQVHGIAGLYVMDASVLPTAGAVNTGLTIMALALRTGQHIAGVAALPQIEGATP